MALVSAQCLAGGQRPCHQTDALVQLDAVADDGRLAHHGAGAVIDEEVRADAGARVQVDAGAGVRPLGHDTGNKRNVLPVELVGEALHGNRFDAGIGDNHFVAAERGGVAVERRVGIGAEQLPDAR